MGWWRGISRNDLVLRLLSLLLAVTLWFLATSGSPRTVAADEQRVSVPLQIQNLGAGVEVSGFPATVDVVVRTPRGMPRSLAGLKAYVDLRGSGPGRREFSVQVEAPGLQVVNVEPRIVTVRIDRVISQLKPVRVAVVGPSPGSGIQIVDIEPREVSIIGAEPKVHEAVEVVAHLDVGGIRPGGRAVRQIPVRAVDRSGVTLFGLQIQPQEVTVVVTLSAATQSSR